MKKRYPVVIVEGLIGAGKTTLSRELGVALGPNTLTLTEPDEKNNANPYLDDYYADKKRWSLTMQLHLLGLRFRMHQDAQWHAMNNRGPVIMDRSYYGDTSFARVQAKLGLMSDREFETYANIYHSMTASVLLPTVCVRILVSPETCNERISKRMQDEKGRRCETSIDLNYLRSLDMEIDHMTSVLRHQGVAILDVPYDVDRDTPQQRFQLTSSLAARINAIEPPDYFLDLHRRTL